MTASFVTYNPAISSPAPVAQMGSGGAPNPVAVHTLTSSEQGLIIANDPASVQVDTSTSPVSVVSNPNFWSQRGAFYTAQQAAIVKSGFNAAISAPFAFTNAAGVASSYAMEPQSQFIYSQSMQNYVIAGESLPSGFTIRDINGVPQTFTVADIKSLYTSIVSFIQSCNATLDSTLANIASSTDYSNCISYVWVTP